MSAFLFWAAREISLSRRVVRRARRHTRLKSSCLGHPTSYACTRARGPRCGLARFIQIRVWFAEPIRPTTLLQWQHWRAAARLAASILKCQQGCTADTHPYRITLRAAKPLADRYRCCLNTSIYVTCRTTPWLLRKYDKYFDGEGS